MLTGAACSSPIPASCSAAFISSPVQGRAFFANIGNTRRQGLDAELRLTTDRWLAYVNYSCIDATFQNTFVEASGNNPGADLNGNITVQPGSRASRPIS